MKIKKYSFIIFLISMLSFGCSQKDNHTNLNSDNFANELDQLISFFKIPGLSVSIDKNGKTIYEDYIGFSDLENKIKVDSTTIYPIASITKVFSGVLVMKLVEQEKIKLSDPISKYIPEFPLGDSILVKHIISHTSQGTNLGDKFYYSSRFSALTKVIEKASGFSFEKYLDREILEPLKLENTFLLKDSFQLSRGNYNIAQPYFLDNGISKGHLDFGYSTSAGIVSTLEDLGKFNLGLDKNELISKESKDFMYTPASNNSPYGHGIFTQELDGLKIIWSYGQYDCYSSLLIKIPSKKITLTLLANNNLMSDPARLIYGDLNSSLFALSFLKNYIFNIQDMDLLEVVDSIDFKANSNDSFFRKKLLSQALAESFMARFDIQKFNTSVALLEKVFLNYPEYLEYANLNLLHNLMFLKDVAFYRELGDFNKFDTQIEKISAKLLSEDPENPYLHNYLGSYYDRKGNIIKTKYHFSEIVSAKNFSKNWYTIEANNWLLQSKEE